METSDWIAIASMMASTFIATIGSALYLSFRIGGNNERIMSMATSIDRLDNRIDKLENTVERNTKELREDITALKSNVGEIRIEMAQMNVKVDKLWRDHVEGRGS
jgi:hypothetical protein